MQGKIRITYTWDKGTCKTAMGYHYALPFNPRWRIICFAAGIISLGVSAGLFLAGRHEAMAVLYLAAGLYFIFFRRYVRVWQSVRNFDRRPDRSAQVEWNIDDESLEGRLDERNRAELTWNKVVRALKTPDGFLIYPLENFFYFLPRSGFTSNTDIDRFDAMVRERVSCYRSV